MHTKSAAEREVPAVTRWQAALIRYGLITGRKQCLKASLETVNNRGKLRDKVIGFRSKPNNNKIFLPLEKCAS